jgi:hypothetical protein
VLERSTVCYFQAGFKVGIATFVGEVNNHVIRDRCSFTYNNKLTAADVVFDVTDDVDAKLTLQTPVSEDIIVADAVNFFSDPA